MAGSNLKDDVAPRLLVALDEMESVAALARMIRLLAPLGVGFKVRPEAVYAFGPEALADAGLRPGRSCGLFMDAKLHDTANSAWADFNCLVDFFRPKFISFHASGSRAMQMELADACQRRKLHEHMLAAVTVTTDVDDAECRDEYGMDVVQRVKLLATKAAIWAKARTFVCGAHEVPLLRPMFRNVKFIVPGIRPVWWPDKGGQRRTATPAEAIAHGADYLVVGRPIVQHADPVAAARSVIEEMAEAIGKAAKRPG